MFYNKIQNPSTGRMVNVNSKLGKSILNNYLNMMMVYQDGGMAKIKDTIKKTKNKASDTVIAVADVVQEKASAAVDVVQEKASAAVDVVQEKASAAAISTKKKAQKTVISVTMPEPSVNSCPLIAEVYKDCMGDEKFKGAIEKAQKLSKAKKDYEALVKQINDE